MHEINVGPLATNVLDLVGREDLVSPGGIPVTIRREGRAFVVNREGADVFSHECNLTMSSFLNAMVIGTKET